MVGRAKTSAWPASASATAPMFGPWAMMRLAVMARFLLTTGSRVSSVVWLIERSGAQFEGWAKVNASAKKASPASPRSMQKLLRATSIIAGAPQA